MGFFFLNRGDINLDNKDVVGGDVVGGDVVGGDVVGGDVVCGDVVCGVLVHGGLHIGFHAFLQNILCLIYDLPFLEK